MNEKHYMKSSPADRLFLGIVYLFLALFVLVVLYPLIYVVSCSFSSPEDLVAGRVFLWPVNPGLQGYLAVFKDTRVWQGYGNTVIYTAAATLIGTIVTFIGSFVLSRKEFPLRSFLTAVFTVTMFFGGGSYISAFETITHAQYDLGAYPPGGFQCLACNHRENLYSVIDTGRTV